MTDLFADIKVGDSVALRTRDGGWTGMTVTRVTRTQFETGSGAKWRKSNGWKVGGGVWDFETAYPWTPERRAEAEKARRVASAEHACWDAATKLNRARGDEAIRLAALLPDELKEPTP